MDEEDIVKCTECNGRELERDDARGEIICANCGLVLDDRIVDPGAEWRVFSIEQGEQRGRVGAPMTEMLHDKGLSTDIDWQNRDYSGKSIGNGRTRSQFYRMRKWQKRPRVSNSRERNLSMALAEMDRIASRLELPKSVRERFARIYRHCIKDNLIRGRSIEGVTAACLYLSCRLCGVPRTLDEIAQSARTGRKEIGRTTRLIKRKLKIRADIPTPDMYTARFCSQLGLGAAVSSKADEIIALCHEWEIDCGRGPVGMCAASIYIAGVVLDNRRTQREIAEIAGVTEVTIRNRYKEIVQRLNIDSTNF